MKKIIDKFWVMMVIVSVCCVDVQASSDSDDRTIGIEVVGKYKNWKDLDNLKAPGDIADSLIDEFYSKPRGWSKKFCLRDETVYETDFRGVSIGGNDNKYIDAVDLFIYVGHGVMSNKHGANDYSFALDPYKGSRYARQSDMYLGNGNLEWLVTFTCNFLESKDKDRIGHMAKGIHAICGFEDTILLTSDMGKVFAKKLKMGVSVKEAFFATAKETKPRHGENIPIIGGMIANVQDAFDVKTAGVFTTKKNANDRIWGYGETASDPKAYNKNNKDKYVLYSYDF